MLLVMSTFQWMMARVLHDDHGRGYCVLSETETESDAMLGCGDGMGATGKSTDCPQPARKVTVSESGDRQSDNLPSGFEVCSFIRERMR